jgi:hypothetical protein
MDATEGPPGALPDFQRSRVSVHVMLILLVSSTLIASEEIKAFASSGQSLARRIAVQDASAASSIRSGGPRSPLAGLFRRQGYLVRDQAGYVIAKARAKARITRSLEDSAGVLAPTESQTGAGQLVALDPGGSPLAVRKWAGVNDVTVTPPDTTGAIGPTRYVQLTNGTFGIYDRTHNAPLTTGTLQRLAGTSSIFVTDPQVIYDPGTERFYFAILDYRGIEGEGDNGLFVGFSRTDSPNNGSTDWCRYFLSYGTQLPDYPKLGDTSRFVLIGANVFGLSGFGPWLGSNVTWMSKPQSGSTCPSAGSLRSGATDALILHDGVTPAWTPVPVNQTDPSATGHVLATEDVGTGGTADFVDVYAVTRDSLGNAVVAPPVGHLLASPFGVPPSAPQLGTAAVLDTLDGRLTQAVSGFDPFRGGLGIWTQHTVAGGAGALVEWYEIDPATIGFWRTGRVQDAELFVFNGAISPDRRVSGRTGRFGGAFVIGFDTVSSNDDVRVQMVSGYGYYELSPIFEVQASGGFNEDQSCIEGACRWGDFSGATPDPASNPYANQGLVWLSNQWNVASADASGVDWRTVNWAVRPVPYVKMIGPSDPFQRATTIGVDWSLENGGVAASVRYRGAPWNAGFGTRSLWQSPTGVAGSTFAGAEGTTYCFSAQPYDQSADLSLRPWGWSGERCTAVPLDDRALTASASWVRGTGSGFFDGTFSRSSTAGGKLEKTDIQAKRISVLVEKCPTCGSLRAYWGTTLLGTWSLAASTTQKMVLLRVANFSSVRTGTLKLLVSSGLVIVDGLAVSRV